MFQPLVARFFPCALAGIILTGCNLNLFDDTSELVRLNQGESLNVDLFTSLHEVDSNVFLREGESYAVDIVTLSHWIDGDISVNENGEPLDQYGFDNSLMPFNFFGAFRRSRQHRWFELILHQPECSNASLRGVTELTVDETSGSYLYVAQCDGELSLFVNDSYGSYLNNVGYANVAVSPMN